jgi:hypothetical protein
MATMTNYGPEEYFIQAICVNFEVQTGVKVDVEMEPDFVTDGYNLKLRLPDGEVVLTLVDKEQLMADTASTTNATLNELVDWFMTEHKKEEWKKEPLPETKEESVEVADMYL